MEKRSLFMKKRKIFSFMFSTIIALSITTNVVKAETINVDALYKNAYIATQKALTDKTQASVNAARVEIRKLPKKLDWAIGEFSKQVDTIQHPIFVKIVNSIKTAEKTLKQSDIDAAKASIPSELAPIFKNSYSSAVDKIQQNLQAKALELVKKAETEKTQVAVGNARLVVNDILTTNNENLRSWAKIISSKLDAIVVVQSAKLEVHYIDVGQGDSILVKQNGESLLIDGGSAEYSDTVLNYLKDNNISNLKYVIATHPHEDHIGGLKKVIDNITVENIIMPKVVHTSNTYENLLKSISNKGIKITTPKSSDTYSIGASTLEILAPINNNYVDLNNYSIISKLKFGNRSFIFTGDAEKLSEGELIDKQLDLSADVLKVAHHGSDSSTSQVFLDAVNPTYAVISVGKDNSYGHPTQTVMNRLKDKNIKTYRTDESGTIIATSDGTNITFNVAPGSGNGGTVTPPIESKKNVEIIGLDLSKEIVTIKNNETQYIDMTGWKLVSVVGPQTYNFPSGYILKAGATITIASGKSTGTLKWTGAYIWNDDGDKAELYDANNNLISEK